MLIVLYHMSFLAMIFSSFNNSTTSFRGMIDFETIPLYWKIERIIWIGFYNHSNDIDDDENNNDDPCLIGQLPKDIVYKILSFIRMQNNKLSCKLNW